ncbi:MAG: hypothetical protein J4O13_04370 [Chloroflexi bacterium]|nr:hypothetical protein [Chloroflexota bacterium]MCI0883601.1 hypothetical protein [Chloroflexota bacterium]MCI0886261.1 hypothetical protein [Chloroflexota bacterium]
MTTASDPVEAETNQYIYHFAPVRDGFDPESMTPQEVAAAEHHYAYLKAATERGQVLLAGRSLDGDGPALVIIEAESADAARGFMENDPFVAEGVMRASLHPFRAALVRAAD